MEQPKGLSPISQLFKESWQTMLASALPLFILLVIGAAIMGGILLFGFILVSIIGVLPALTSGGAAGFEQSFRENLPAVIGPMIGVGTIFLIAYVLVASALQIAMVLVVDSNGKASIGDVLRKSIGLIIPLFIVSLISGLLIFGSFFVFFFPAIFVSILLSFASYEVILNNQRLLGALKRSVLIVSAHFGGILGRLAIIYLIYLGLSIIPEIGSAISESVGLILNLAMAIVNLLLGWFALAYSINLYKQARVGFEGKEGKSMTWIWILSAVGWVLAILLFFGIIAIASSGVFQNAVKESIEESEQMNNQTPGYPNMNSEVDFDSTSSSEVNFNYQINQ